MHEGRIGGMGPPGSSSAGSASATAVTPRGTPWPWVQAGWSVMEDRKRDSAVLPSGTGSKGIYDKFTHLSTMHMKGPGGCL